MMYFVFAVLAVVVALCQVVQSADGSVPCKGCSTVCSILPPPGSDFLCYEGSPSDTTKCFSTDPLIKANSTTICDTCANVGYTVYIRNDPIYVNMGLWNVPSAKP